MFVPIRVKMVQKTQWPRRVRAAQRIVNIIKKKNIINVFVQKGEYNIIQYTYKYCIVHNIRLLYYTYLYIAVSAAVVIERNNCMQTLLQ